MNPDSNTPAAAAPVASVPTSSTPVTATPAATPFAKGNPNQGKGGKPFGNKKAKFNPAAPKL